jgi:hypothetical protein
MRASASVDARVVGCKGRNRPRDDGIQPQAHDERGLEALNSGLLLFHFEIRQQSRPWECANPEGISKECGKGEKPVSWLSTLAILCHLHGLLWKRVSKNRSHREGPFWGQEPFVRDGDYSAIWLLPRR